MNDAKILVIEDDKNIIKFLNISLKTNGYDFLSAGSGIEGISLFMTDNPDVILLDLGLPDIDGVEVISQIRAQSDVPILVVSARGQEIDKVRALDEGADDFICKPFHINELLARIRVALRKKNQEKSSITSFSVGEFEIDFVKYRVRVGDRELHLTPIEHKIVLLLVQNAGRVLTHSYIIKQIWGYNSSEESQSLRVFMANIRRKIEPDTTHPRYILTEIGVGYRFADE